MTLGHSEPAAIADLNAPIGVFDSGVGGLSVLRALMNELPDERFTYVADSGHAPYGEREDTHIVARAHAITRHLLREDGIKALVVACNTATAAAIVELRDAFPQLPIVGIEPALKPAVAQSRTKRIGVLATRGTLQSDKFGKLLQALQGEATFVLQACDGLADAIEHNDATRIAAICDHHLHTMGPFGLLSGQIDTLVLGCTHYPFAIEIIRAGVGAPIELLEAGIPVARQTRRLLMKHHGLLQPGRAGSLNFMHRFATTGNANDLTSAIERWLGMKTTVTHHEIPG